MKKLLTLFAVSGLIGLLFGCPYSTAAPKAGQSAAQGDKLDKGGDQVPVGGRAAGEKEDRATLKRVQENLKLLRSEAGRKLSPEERREKFRELNRDMQKLSAEDRKKLDEPQRTARLKTLRRFFKMSPQEQLAQLDRDIDRMEALRQRWARLRAERGGGAGGGPTGRGTGAGSPGGPGTRSEGQPKRRPASPELSPGERELKSLNARYRKMFAERLQQRGLRPVGGLARPVSKDRLTGKWELVKTDHDGGTPEGGVVEIARDGTLKVTATVEGRRVTAPATYEVVGDKIVTTRKEGGNDVK